MLTRIYADNFRSLVGFECIFGPLQVLIGPNGSGKSTILELLQLVRDVCVFGVPLERQLPETQFGELSRTRWLQKQTQTVELDVRGNGGDYRFRLCLETAGQPLRPRIIEELITFNQQPIFCFRQGEVELYNENSSAEKLTYPFDWHRSALATIAERNDNTRVTWLKNWLKTLLCLQPVPWNMSGTSDREDDFLEPDLSNLANWYRHMILQKNDPGFFNDLESVIDGFQSLNLEKIGGVRREMSFLIQPFGARTTGRPCNYGLMELSEGQRVLVGLYAVLNFAAGRGGMLAFDEPENFVALGEILPWLTRIVDLTMDGSNATQVLIATHHPELINRYGFKEGLFFDRLDGRETRVRPISDTLATGLTPSELMIRGWMDE